MASDNLTHMTTTERQRQPQDSAIARQVNQTTWQNHKRHRQNRKTGKTKPNKTTKKEEENVPEWPTIFGLD
jgi:hypothetical protein